MSTCKSNLKRLKGRGSVWMAARASDGTLGEQYHIGECRVLNINETPDWEEIYSMCDPNSGQIARDLNRIDIEVSLTVLDHSAEMLAKAIYGSTSAVTGTSVTDESLGDFTDGQSKQVAHPFSLTSVTVSDGSGPLVEDTDYTIDTDHGRVTAIGAQTAVTIDYTYADYDKIEAYVTSVPEYAIFADVYNTADSDNPWVAEMYRVSLNPASVISLLTENSGELELNGKLMIDDTKSGSGISKYWRLRIKS